MIRRQFVIEETIGTPRSSAPDTFGTWLPPRRHPREIRVVEQPIPSRVTASTIPTFSLEQFALFTMASIPGDT